MQSSCTSASVPTMVDVKGSRVRIMTREGSADYTRPLLLLNGIGARFEMWLPFCDALAHRPILLFDIPGISGNPAREFPNQMPGLAHWLTQLMDVMNVGEADVL